MAKRNLALEYLAVLSTQDPTARDQFLEVHRDRRAELLMLERDFSIVERRLRSWGEEQRNVGTESSPCRVLNPTLLPGYRLLRVLGAGGMGTVFAAEEESLQRLVAVKTIPRGNDAQAVARFLREAESIARIASDHVVRVYAKGATDEFLYYAMELLDGTTLRALLRSWRERLHPDRYRRAAEILESACIAADHVHAAQVVHRDIKPSNIFITTDGCVKLIDFGLVHIDGERSLTRSGSLVGTPVYMSPEQARSDGSIDRRADIYSLGATLYEAATLREPFEGAVKHTLRIPVLHLEPVPPRSADPALPRDLAAIIERAMEFETSSRYPGAGEMAKDLRAFLSGEPVSVRPIGPAGRLWRRVRRRQRLLWGSSAAIGAVILLALVIAWQWVESNRRTLLRQIEADARGHERQYHRLEHELDELRSRAVQLREQILDSDDYLTRQPLFDLEHRIHLLEAEAQDSFHRAVLAGQRGLEVSADSGELRDLLVELLWERYLRSEQARDDAERRRIEPLLVSYGPEYRTRLEAWGRVSLATRPPGAEVWLFRYEPDGPFLRPVPYHPDHGTVVELMDVPPPTIRVAREPDKLLQALGIRRGDRIISIAGKQASLLGNRLIASLWEGGDVEFERAGKRFNCRVPPAYLKDGIWVHPWLLLNHCVDTAAFPLVALPRACLGWTPNRDVRIAAGAYLALLRHRGFRDTRLSFVVDRDAAINLVVNLYTEAEIGEDFVYVPGGTAAIAGDPAAFYPEPRRLVTLPDYFVSRYELTAEEYFKFLNDPLIKREIEAGLSTEGRSLLLPVAQESSGSLALWEVGSAGQLRPRASYSSERVLRWVSRSAALRFVEWMNVKEHARAGIRLFALPSADELEKAGRGADGRFFPWGNGFDVSLVATHRSAGNSDLRNLRFPADASPYDVRDLAGSLREWTRDDVGLPPVYKTPSTSRVECRVKGGSFHDDLEPFFRLGGHTRERARSADARIGFRLVAYPRRPRADGTRR